MKDKTTLRMMGGSWYGLIPPAFARHMGISEEDTGKILEGEIQDEVGKYGEYISMWKFPQKKKVLFIEHDL